jgi:thymidine phosphorylase
MNTPLGLAAGNWLEVKESVDCLDGGGPEELRELVLTFAVSLLVQTGQSKSSAAARRRAEACLNSGAPRKKWNEMLQAQGADLDAFHEKLGLDHTAPVVVELKAGKSGFVATCDARLIGEVIRELGGGRLTKETPIHFEVGLDQIAKPGRQVRVGDTLCRIHAASRAQAKTASERLASAFKLSARPVQTAPVVCRVFGAK